MNCHGSFPMEFAIRVEARWLAGCAAALRAHGQSGYFDECVQGERTALRQAATGKHRCQYKCLERARFPRVENAKAFDKRTRAR